MHQTLAGFISGAVSGIIMGLISDILFRLHIFKSSLFAVDGSFLFRTLRLKENPPFLYVSGLCIHLITSGIFGSIYAIATTLFGFDSLSFLFVCLYIIILWLSMLFIALPISGEGFLGKKSGPLTWLEQLFLHAIFCVLYYLCLRVLL
ncbi:MAG: hypothetical protein NT178_04730 [Proteobacteria bacterium]|nr:hypothetical protein [Pseudomonadota bacterium]